MWPAALIHVLSRAADGRAGALAVRQPVRRPVVDRRGRRSTREPS